jgi:hypothetical protein
MMRLSSLFLACLGAAACGKVVNAPDASHVADAPVTADAPIADAPITIDAPVMIDARPPDGATGSTTFTSNSQWSCASLTDCEDVYDFDVAASAKITATISAVTGASTPRLGLFAGTTTTGTDLFTGAAKDLCSASNQQDVDLTGGPVTVAAGHYRLTVGRDWNASAGAAGTYTITITSTVTLSNPTQSADDQASNQPHC